MPAMGEARIDAETGVVQHFLGWAGAYVHIFLCTWHQQNAALHPRPGCETEGSSKACQEIEDALAKSIVLVAGNHVARSRHIDAYTPCQEDGMGCC